MTQTRPAEARRPATRRHERFRSSTATRSATDRAKTGSRGERPGVRGAIHSLMRELSFSPLRLGVRRRAWPARRPPSLGRMLDVAPAPRAPSPQTPPVFEAALVPLQQERPLARDSVVGPWLIPVRGMDHSEYGGAVEAEADHHREVSGALDEFLRPSDPGKAAQRLSAATVIVWAHARTTCLVHLATRRVFRRACNARNGRYRTPTRSWSRIQRRPTLDGMAPSTLLVLNRGQR